MRGFPLSVFLLTLGLGMVRSSMAEPVHDRPARDRGRMHPRPDRLKEGDQAPNFRLKSPTGKKTVSLASFAGRKPVALVFGSYT